jgi:type IV secretion/conjugal transfer VirB4 family ATPase
VNGIADGVKRSGDALGGGVPTGQIAVGVLLYAEVGKDGKGRGLGLQFALLLSLIALEPVLVQKLVRQFVGQRAAFRGGGQCRVDNHLPALAPAVRGTRLFAILQHDIHGGGCGFKAGQKSFASSLGAVFKLGNVLAFGVGDVEDVGHAESAQLHRGNPLGCPALRGFEYRWNTRAVLLDPEEAKKIITDALKKWTAKARGFVDQLMGRPPKRIDPFALKMMEDATVAIGEASSGDVQFVLYSGNIILMDEDNEGVKDRARQVAKIIKNLGFGARLESFNAVEAWRGTLPGDGYRNVRRIILHTLNLADCMPIAAIWTGDRVNSSALMPKNSEPLMYATSTGSTVFRFNLHVGDLAHTLVVGPPGAGKSTLLCGIEAQFFRYPNAQVFVFDKGYSAWALNQAAGGEFYNLGSEDGGMSFAPFAELDTTGDIAWAAQYIEQLCALAGHTVVPTERKEILKALQLLVQSKTRTFTELLVNLQNLSLRDALRVYTLEGSLGGLLEAKANQSVLGHGRFMVFEMEHLMGMGERAVVSVLLFLFHQIEKRLDGSPTAIVLDEAWVFLKHELFKEFIRDWAKTLRKANAALMLSTQNWSDIFNSSLKDVLIETCPNKIFLPNPEATSETVRVYYEMLGVNAREIEMISRAIPKREYYQRTPNGRRLFNIGFGPVALAFVGVSGPEVRARIGEIRKTHGEGWISEWLRVRGVPNWADYFETKYGMKKSGLKLVS